MVNEPGKGKALSVVALQTENFKRVKVARLRPKLSGATVVTGDNDNGKTSLLDSLWAVLKGAAFKREEGGIAHPVRTGSERAEATLFIGRKEGEKEIVELVVTRIWTEKSGAAGRLEVRNGEGMLFPTPQKLLDGLLTRCTVDPLAFANAKAADRIKMLLSVCVFPDVAAELAALQIKVNPGDNLLQEIERRRQVVYEQRTTWNRDLATKQNEAGVLRNKLPSGWESLESVDTAATLKSIQDLQGSQARATMARDTMEKAKAKREDAQTAYEKAEEDLRRADMDLEAATEEFNQAEREAGGVPDRIAREQAKLTRAAEIATAIANRGEYERAAAAATHLEGKTRGLSGILDGIAALKKRLVAEVRCPVPGLMYDPVLEDVAYNGVPFSQAASSQKLRVGIRLAIAEMQEKIGRGEDVLCAIRMEEAALLDPENMRVLDEEAELEGIQVFCERPSDPTSQLILEDGVLLSGEEVRMPGEDDAPAPASSGRKAKKGTTPAPTLNTDKNREVF